LWRINSAPGVDFAKLKVINCSEHGHPVTGHHWVIPPWTLNHAFAIAGHDCYGSQVAEVPTKRWICRSSIRHLYLNDRELNACQLDLVGVAAKARFDE
jgi:hypothetical protein